MRSISVSVNQVYSMKHSQNWNFPTLTGYIEITKKDISAICGSVGRIWRLWNTIQESSMRNNHHFWTCHTAHLSSVMDWDMTVKNKAKITALLHPIFCHRDSKYKAQSIPDLCVVNLLDTLLLYARIHRNVPAEWVTRSESSSRVSEQRGTQRDSANTVLHTSRPAVTYVHPLSDCPCTHISLRHPLEVSICKMLFLACLLIK